MSHARFTEDRLLSRAGVAAPFHFRCGANSAGPKSRPFSGRFPIQGRHQIRLRDSGQWQEPHFGGEPRLVLTVLVAQPSEEVFGFRRSAVADKTIVRPFSGIGWTWGVLLLHNEGTVVIHNCE